MSLDPLIRFRCLEWKYSIYGQFPLWGIFLPPTPAWWGLRSSSFSRLSSFMRSCSFLTSSSFSKLSSFLRLSLFWGCLDFFGCLNIWGRHNFFSCLFFWGGIFLLLLIFVIILIFGAISFFGGHLHFGGFLHFWCHFLFLGHLNFQVPKFLRMSLFFGSFSFLRLSSKIVNFCRTEKGVKFGQFQAWTKISLGGVGGRGGLTRIIKLVSV